MKIKAIITGATGMVGEGVLHNCLISENVESVLVIGRKSCGITHPKLKEIILPNLADLSPIEDQLSGYNACYFCAGVSSIGKKEEEYTLITYHLTLSFAKVLAKLNKGMTFCYVSGQGTDSSENGKLMWARVKGRTENDLMRLPFKAVYNFRPGYIQPIEGLQNAYKIYKIFVPFYTILHKIFPNSTVKLSEIGDAMINLSLNGYVKHILECRDIVEVAKNKV